MLMGFAPAVTSTITDLVINLISDRANLLDSFVILYATLLAALYKVKGLEFGKAQLPELPAAALTILQAHMSFKHSYSNTTPLPCNSPAHSKRKPKQGNSP